MKFSLGRFLQACGLIVVPMALFYYIDHAGTVSDLGLGATEWAILTTGMGIFLLGRYLER